MATIEDAINARIQHCEKRNHPSQNLLNNREMNIWIKLLKCAPRDLAEIQKAIDRKEQQRKAMLSVEQARPITSEIKALEWVQMILRCPDTERASWSKLA